MQRGALLDAARSLLSEGGTEALTFPALAERTGLARSSVYEYFRSRAAVVEELCAVDFPVWAAEVENAMEQASTPEGKIEAYVRPAARPRRGPPPPRGRRHFGERAGHAARARRSGPPTAG